MKKLLLLLLSFALLLTLSACTPTAPAPAPDPDPGDNHDPVEPSANLIITPSQSVAAISDRITFTVSGENFDAESLTFTFSDPTLVYTPAHHGLTCEVRVKAAGVLTVTVNSGEVSASCQVTLVPRNMDVYADHPYISHLGRTEGSDGELLISNTAAGFGCTFYGRRLTATLTNVGSTSGAPALFTVYVDGEAAKQITFADLAQPVVLAEFNKAGVHTVRVQKIVEEDLAKIALTEVNVVGGALLPYEKPNYAFKMEVYGDSITAGYGNLRSEGTSDSKEMQNGLLTYAALAAQGLNAEYRTFCRSGIGLYTNPYGNKTLMKDVYQNVSPTSKTPWDMTAYTPDVVVINIGTNDIWHKGGYDEAVFVDHYVSMVIDLYNIYGKDTVFILCTSMMADTDSAITAIADELQDGGIRATAVKLTPRATTNNGHPYLAEQRVAANELMLAITQALGIPMPE